MERYTKIAEIDGQSIYKDKEGFFTYEHYQGTKGYYSIPIRLGTTVQEIKETMSDLLNWHYRAWHEDMKEILGYHEQIESLVR